ncbi:MAG: hypothetical protein H7270_15085 [Dermatophilaceae bacterium]|nr:hypothetical protein [Dermatophilaceae bacterium]
MRLKSILTAIASAAILIGTTAAPAQAAHAWGQYHWSTTNGIVAKTIYSSVTSDWSGNLAVANSDWNTSTHLQNTVVASATDLTTRTNCPMVAGAIRVCNAAYGGTGWSGLASINISGSHITQGNTKLNDTYEAGAPAAERQGVMCQEVGHDFGLGHQDENFTNPNLGTCMDYTNNWTTNQHPNTHDYDQLNTIYNHADAASKARHASAAPGQTRIQTGDTVTMITWAN